jgi:WD40-like Beta Propeller Repeat
VVFVCGKDLCSASDGGSERVPLTRDGGAAPYTSPSVSRSGKRNAYTRGERGRVFTARLTRRGARISGLRGIRRIPPFRDGPATPRGSTSPSRGPLPGGLGRAADQRRLQHDRLSPLRRPFRRARAPTASPGSEQNGTCRGPGARQLAFDPSGRHLRHPDVFGRRLVATAYPYDAGEPDNAIQRPGAIVLFDTATARPVRDLTSASGDSSPVFSPDGRRVAFERGGSVYTVPVSGGAPRRVLRRAREPSWSR